MTTCSVCKGTNGYHLLVRGEDLASPSGSWRTQAYYPCPKRVLTAYGRQQLIDTIERLEKDYGELLERTRSMNDLLPGWSCPKCFVFNGDAKEKLTACRCCGSPRP